jgi:hypothetical protein
MTTRLEMADALLSRATQRRSEIGDHGDSYEASLLAGVVQIELRIVVKEIFDHLRSALDYAAREVVALHGTTATTKPIYFPIVAKGFAAKDFGARFGQLMPGVAVNRPDLPTLFASFQPFSSSDNDWIADFATLCNESKHENLIISTTEGLRTIYSRDSQGQLHVRYVKKDGTLFRRSPLMLVSNAPVEGGEATSHYICLTDIDEEVLWFLDRCLAGVSAILQSIRSAS